MMSLSKGDAAGSRQRRTSSRWETGSDVLNIDVYTHPFLAVLHHAAPSFCSEFGISVPDAAMFLLRSRMPAGGEILHFVQDDT